MSSGRQLKEQSPRGCIKNWSWLRLGDSSGCTQQILLGTAFGFIQNQTLGRLFLTCLREWTRSDHADRFRAALSRTSSTGVIAEIDDVVCITIVVAAGVALVEVVIVDVVAIVDVVVADDVAAAVVVVVGVAIVVASRKRRSKVQLLVGARSG